MYTYMGTRWALTLPRRQRPVFKMVLKTGGQKDLTSFRLGLGAEGVWV